MADSMVALGVPASAVDVRWLDQTAGERAGSAVQERAAAP
jgi:hypothetical protein